MSILPEGAILGGHLMVILAVLAIVLSGLTMMVGLRRYSGTLFLVGVILAAMVVLAPQILKQVAA